jgi:hypothetical protein
MVALELDSAITMATVGPAARIASASSMVSRGLLCWRSCSSSVMAGAVRDTVNASAANCDWIILVTLAFKP